jgi:zinc transporter ZupT
MPINFIFIAVFSLLFGALFFIVEFYHRELPKINISLIAGVSISYFFLVILTEIAENIPVFPFEITTFEYLPVLIGFVFVHTSEKLILQSAESKSQRRMRKLIEKEKNLDGIEKNIQQLLTTELDKEDLDDNALKDIAQALKDLNRKSNMFKPRIIRYKAKIEKHLILDLGNLRFFTNFSYHLFVGIIVVGLLTHNIIGGILFFFFAWFRAVITNRSEKPIMFTDLEIYDTYDIERHVARKYILALSNLIGVLAGLFLYLINFAFTQVFFIFYSFISGVILYTIVREVLPQKEKGNPLYFIIGFIGFTLVIIAITFLTSFIY